MANPIEFVYGRVSSMKQGLAKDLCVSFFTIMQMGGWQCMFLCLSIYMLVKYFYVTLGIIAALSLLLFLNTLRLKFTKQAPGPYFGVVDTSESKVQREIKAKEALRESFLNKFKQGLVDDGSINDPRIPGGVAPGQKWAYGGAWPIIDIRTENFEFKADDNYRLLVTNCGKDGTEEMYITMQELRDMSQDYEDINMHCVTTCSARSLKFRGVSWRKIVERANPPPNWTWMTQFGRDGYTTNVPREEVMLEGIAEPFIAIGMYDQQTDELAEGLPYIHGVVRPFFPRLYGWKGCKWLTGLRFDQEMVPGFWEESGGAHNRGRIDLQERFDIWNHKSSENLSDIQKGFEDIRKSILMLVVGAMFRGPFPKLALWGQRNLGVLSRRIMRKGNSEEQQRRDEMDRRLKGLPAKKQE